MKKLRKRLLITFFVFSSMMAFLFYMLMTRVIEERFISQQDESMTTELKVLSVVIENILNDDQTADLRDSHMIRRLSEQQAFSDERLTLIDQNGVVVFDSEKNSLKMKNHSTRHEVAKVLAGADIARHKRESETSSNVEYYIAVPVKDQQDNTIGVIRLSKNLSTVYDLTTISLIGTLISIFLFLMIVFFMIRHWLAKMESGLAEIEDVADQLVVQNYDKRYAANSYDEINHVGRCMNHLADSIEQHVREKEVNEEQIQELINNLVIGVMLLDEHRNILMTNPAMNQIVGFNLYGQINRDYNEVIKSSDIVTLVERAYEKDKNTNGEITIYYPDEKILDVNVVPIPSKTSDEHNMIVLLYDITEIRRLEKIRTDFATNASHELRTPITALKGFSETLLDGAMYDEEVLTEFLQIMNKEAERLDTIVQDILQLSRLEQKISQVNAEPVRIKEVTEEVFQILQQKAEIKEIKCQVIEEKEIYVFADRDHLKQIILNLVANALSYTGEKGKVLVKISTTDEEVCLQVIDNGIGIPEEDMHRIFERFYRVDRARSRNAGGTGLGLSIVRWLVDSMNARIEVDSELGKGTTFSIYFTAMHDE